MYYIIEELTREFQSAKADYRLTDNQTGKDRNENGSFSTD